MIRITSCTLIRIHHFIMCVSRVYISQNKSLVEHESLATVEVLTETLLNCWKDKLDETLHETYLLRSEAGTVMSEGEETDGRHEKPREKTYPLNS